jgi:hypothetical protein
VSVTPGGGASAVFGIVSPAAAGEPAREGVDYPAAMRRPPSPT